MDHPSKQSLGYSILSQVSHQGKSLVQLTHGFTVGDAVSDSVRLIHESALGLGYESRIFALSIHKDLSHLAMEASDAVSKADILVLHYSIGGRILDLFFHSEARVKGFVFHNITPPEYFSGYNEHVYRNVSSGIELLRCVVEGSKFIISVSEFNVKTLKSFVGSIDTPTFILPLAVPDWKTAQPTFFDRINWLLIPKQLRKKKAKLLYVGRVAPNKNLETLIRIFREFKYAFEGDSVLWIVGSEVDCEIYRAELEALALMHGVSDAVIFWGHVSEGLLRLFYQHADCFITVSKHEGFCVPVIEAFKFGLPVIAENGSGIAETVGQTGLLVDSSQVSDVARLIHRAIFDEAFKQQVLEIQRDRYQYFSKANFNDRLANILQSIQRISDLV